MPIPDFREDGWLPPGRYAITRKELIAFFGGEPGSGRELLTQKLLNWSDAVRNLGVRGTLLLGGSYISAKPEPRDFDMLLIAQPDIQALKDLAPALALLLDAQRAEQNGYSLFFIPSNSPQIETICTMWNETKSGVPRGIVEVHL